MHGISTYSIFLLLWSVSYNGEFATTYEDELLIFGSLNSMCILMVERGRGKEEAFNPSPKSTKLYMGLEKYLIFLLCKFFHRGPLRIIFNGYLFPLENIHFLQTPLLDP